MFAEILASRLAGLVPVTPHQAALLEQHYELLCRWNRVLNLTRIEEVEEAVERHYCESLFLARHLPPTPLTVADLGSGAGFPGIPVAVMRPDCQVTLVESHQRKAVFLKEAARWLPNVRVFAGRAETVGERFDHGISRAVSYLDLVPVLKKMAGAADLLTGIEEPPASLGLAWQAPILLPWGKQRFLRIGQAAPGS